MKIKELEEAVNAPHEINLIMMITLYTSLWIRNIDYFLKLPKPCSNS